MYPSALTWHGSDRSDKAFNRFHLSGSCSLYSFWKPGTRDTYVSPEMHLRASSQGQVSGGSHVQTEGPLGQFSTLIPGLARTTDRGLVLLLHLGGGNRSGFQSTGVPWGTGVPLPGGGDLTALTWHPPPFPSCWPSCPVCWEPHRYPQYFQDSVAISITDVTSTPCGCTNPSLSSLSRKRKSPETSVT